MKIGVVGAGLMGAEIALVFALAGHPVVLNDLDDAALERGMLRLAKLLDKGVDRGFYTREGADAAFARIHTSPDLKNLADCHLVTEAVFEALEAKEKVLRALDNICQPECILASNTSTLPISTLAAVVAPARQRRFLGTHYFSPVSRMKLVEVIPAFGTDDAVTAQVKDMLRRIGKEPVQVKDVAGFAVNRLLHAMLIEAVKLVEEGVATPEDLDTACCLGLGHAVGPFALMDAVTSSLCLQVQDILHDAYGERFRPPALLKQRVAAGLTGGRDRAGWLRQG